MQKFLYAIGILGFVLTPIAVSAVTYATFDPATKDGAVTLSGGNLTASSNAASWGSAFSTISKTTGKWYWEMELVANPYNGTETGIIETTYSSTNTFFGDSAYGWGYRADGQKESASAQFAYGSAYSPNDIIGVALNLDAGTVTFYKNGVSQGTAFTSLSGDFYAAIAINGLAGISSYTANFGATTFDFSAPSGFCEGLSDTCVITGGGGTSTSTDTTSNASTTAMLGSIAFGINIIIVILFIGICGYLYNKIERKKPWK